MCSSRVHLRRAIRPVISPKREDFAWEGVSLRFGPYLAYHVFMWPSLHVLDALTNPVVFKHGVATGLTRGQASLALMFTSTRQVRLVVPSSVQSLFSQMGDCGSIVFDHEGNQVGMITSGSPPGFEFCDFTLITAMPEITERLQITLCGI
jgi:hypothetical protein